MIGRRPYAAVGNSNGDREMLEWIDAGAAPGSGFWSCTTTPPVSKLALPRAYPTPRSAP